MNKNLKSTALFFIASLFFSYNSIAQRLVIHVINVQQGSAILVRGPEKTLLFDGGKGTYAESYLIPYLEQLNISKDKGINYVVISHGDEDHYGGVKKLAKEGYDFDSIYDNDGAKQYAGAERKICNNTSCSEILAMNVGETIELGDGAYAKCVAVRGEIIDGSRVSIPHENSYENDMSIVLLIKYKDFEFIAGGDLGGGNESCTGRTTGQLDVETAVVNGLVNAGLVDSNKGIEVMHVNHHGAESSTNSNYMNILSPQVAVISTGGGQGANYHHPRKAIVENVLMAEADCITADPALVLQTDQEQTDKAKASKKGYTVGDVIIVTSGTNNFGVMGTGRIEDYGNNETTDAGIDSWRQFDID